ncbi:beta-fructofuranosidase/levanase [Mucilaginibacter oryzae]|uniref:Beta-fructofuranosidase/levanase n=1 Tax=Mucilaginibacter oryzae TaxID=468058 RepID=A0A316HXG0_9SPHI|nr:GH32 C-terminal domain-containing protein [Mucilaginibacter oryzae]PWK79702.1 beta-fructofuranosidase/levanase [Mucilaginibacter oryzae]
MQKIERYILLLIAFAPMCLKAQQSRIEVIKQKYRPLYHFSPAKGWIGDPDGLVFNNGLYHLFWWGHATSPDLVHWQEQPRPMKGDDGRFSYFSGSVAVDNSNTSGFGKKSMVAVFTRHFPGDTLPETQVLSISNDSGKTFHYYQNNPVLDIKKIFFRDPQVFFYQPDKRWKMVVTRPDIQQICIYESPDLKNWSYCSSFSGLGAKNSFWECPDLFQLPVEGRNTKKWVMIIGRGPNKVQYFVGDFDGRQFIPAARTVDYLKNGKGIDGIVFDDFETGVEKRWKYDGAAFRVSKKLDVSDYLGNGFAGSAVKSSSTGKMISQTFTIKHSAINFLLAGGNHQQSICISLVIGKKVYRTATGDNTKVLKWNGWDVRELIGKRARLEIIDSNPDTSNAYIAVDHIIFSNKLMNHQLEHAQWLDYGPDYYATRTWRNYDAGKNMGDSVFSLGWMGNWQYAGKVPTTWGKGFESLPRLLTLRQTNSGYQIIQQPVPQLAQLRGPERRATVNVTGSQKLDSFKPTKNSYEIAAVFTPSVKANFGMSLLTGEGRKLLLSYDPVTSILTLDRTNCTDFVADTAFTRLFAGKITAPVALKNGKLHLHIFVDRASVEVFANEGEMILSAATFPSEEQLGILLFSNGGPTNVSLKAWELKTIWEQ